MQEPSIRTSRLAIAGGLAIAIAFGALGFGIGRSTAPAPGPAAPIAPPGPAASLGFDNDRVLRRADLLDLARAAADSAASGSKARGPLAAMPGQRFELVLPFGCSGPSDTGPTMRWRYDPDNGALRITVEPVRWEPGDWGPGERARFEVAEGFWVSRPWNSSEACPQDGGASPPNAEPITLPGQTLAIAQFFADAGHRNAQRDGRPYQTVTRVPVESFDGSRGFLLRLTGRVAEVPGGGVAHCVQPGGAEQRPVCVIAVRMDEVAVEDPATGEVIAAWPTEATG